MNRQQLEHIIRAAGDVLGTDAVIIVGSQAILATFPEFELPAAAISSLEADVLPYDDPDESKADLIDGVMGELSRFHETHGIFADGVSPATICAPSGWLDRLIPYCNENTNGVTGRCLDRHDLCVAKLVAGREKDWRFVRELARAGKVDPAILRERVSQTSLSQPSLTNIERFLDGLGSPKG